MKVRSNDYLPIFRGQQKLSMREKSQFVKSVSYIYKIRLISSFLILFLVTNVFSTDKKVITAQLVENGFENIRIKIENARILIAYENRVYRFEVEALNEVIKIVVPLIDDREELILIPLNRKIPIIKFLSSIENCKAFLGNKINAQQFIEDSDIKLDVDREYNFLLDESEFNSSNLRFDLVIKWLQLIKHFVCLKRSLYQPPPEFFLETDTDLILKRRNILVTEILALVQILELQAI
ncbi:MAG: hypothetical protein FD122_1722 [Stygiobacter sp.]|nr:MAG: hypothetical protein FD122_1722 [Stygiobacter sp.]